jgi:phospholipid/cholesterol/gamma-HCH transport system substrate-binding protein
MYEKRSIIVGVFVLVGGVLLAVMIFWFGQVAFFIRGGYIVHGHLPSAVGVRAGKRVHMDGIDCGEVQDVRTSQPRRPGVWVDMHISPGVSIPADAAFVAQQSTIGDLYLDFQTPVKQAPEALMQAAEQLGVQFRKDRFGLWHILPSEEQWPPPAWQFNIVSQPFWGGNPIPPLTLSTDGTARVVGRVVAPSLLPEELVADVRKGLSTLKALEPVAVNIQKLTEPRTLKDVEAGQPRNFCTMIEQFEVTGRLLQAQLDQKDSNLNKLLVDADLSAQKLQEALDTTKKTLAAAESTLKTVGAKTGEVADRLGKTADKADDVMGRLGKAVDGATATMNSINQTFEKINKGEGTLGKLATDPELYRALTTLLENLQDVADNADRVLTLWREQGIFAKEGK